MILKNKKVAIIGAGPVGLTLATLLQQKGADVTVYERDKDAQTRIWGGTLDLHVASGQKALKKAGLLQNYFRMAIPMGRKVADEQAHVFFSAGLQTESPEINRNDLKKILLDSLISNTVVWDRKLTGLDVFDGKWLLHFENKPDAVADLVIGANGGMSKVRTYVTDLEVEDTGTIIIQGEVVEPEIKCPEFYKLCNDSVLMCSHQGNLFVANPKNSNALTYAVMFRKPEDWPQERELNVHDPNHVINFLTDKLDSWDKFYKQIFQSTTSFVGLHTRKLPLDKSWKEDRQLPVTLIGDAAHVMPPFAGKGVNTGLLDALILSDNLTDEKFQTIEAAIKDYEQRMFVYAKEAQLESSQNEIEMFNPGFSFKKRFS